MRNLATTVLTILLLTLFQPAGGCSPPIESKDMPKKFNLTFEDPMELRARGKASPLVDRPWAGNNELGHGAFILEAGNNRQSILKSSNEWGMPKVWTLALGINTEEVPLNFDVVAEIEFGSGGATQTVEIDWINGTSITLPMNAWNVTALYNGPTTPDGQIYLTATLAQGEGHNSRPVRSIAYLVLAGATRTEQIPKFAKSVTIMRAVSATGSPESPFSATASYIFSTPNGNSRGSFLGTEIAAFANEIPIPLGATQLSIVNGAGLALDVRAVFNIGL